MGRAGRGLCAALLWAALARTAGATSPATLTIKVTVNASLSLNIGTMTAINFGTLAPGNVVASSDAVVITNDSTGLVEDYTITASTFIATGGTQWSVSGSTGTAQDVFALCAMINPSAVSTTTFAAGGNGNCFAPGTESASETYMNTTQFGSGVSGSNTNGDHVPSGATRALWVYFAAPKSVTTEGGPNSATITLTANSAGLFP